MADAFVSRGLKGHHMTRRTVEFTVTDNNRDKGKKFLITELSSEAGEEWALKLFFALANTGVDIPDEIRNAGMAGVARLGLSALGKLPFDVAQPLLREMFTCIQFIPGARNVVRDLLSDDIEEVWTRLQLRGEVLKLHVDFFTNAAPSSSDSTATA